MKRALLCVLSLLTLAVYLPVGAQEITALGAGDLPVITEGNVTYAEMIGLMEAAKPTAPGLKPTPDVTYEGSEPLLVFPVAGSAGAFRTETVLVNRKSSPQRISAWYWPIGAGAANCDRTGRTMTLAAGRSYFYRDFIPDLFGESGFGTVFVFGVDSSNNNDPTALLDASSRIWSPAAGGGTASQNFPSMAYYWKDGPQSAIGLRSDQFFRSNWGMVNASTTARTFDITFIGSNGSRMQIAKEIPPCTLIQERVPGGPYEFLEIVFTPRDGGGRFWGYGSSVDNTSSDSFSVPSRRLGGR